MLFSTFKLQMFALKVSRFRKSARGNSHFNDPAFAFEPPRKEHLMINQAAT
jgi:hypothetical protein